MRETILSFGLMAAAIALLVLLGDYNVTVRPRRDAWIVGVVAAGLIGVGLILGRYLYAARKERPLVERQSEDAVERAAAVGLTPREMEVLLLVAEGRSNQEIGDALFIAETTVKTHVSNILAKLEADRRTHAVRIAKQHGILH